MGHCIKGYHSAFYDMLHLYYVKDYPKIYSKSWPSAFGRFSGFQFTVENETEEMRVEYQVSGQEQSFFMVIFLSVKFQKNIRNTRTFTNFKWILENEVPKQNTLWEYGENINNRLHHNKIKQRYPPPPSHTHAHSYQCWLAWSHNNTALNNALAGEVLKQGSFPFHCKISRFHIRVQHCD